MTALKNQKKKSNENELDGKNSNQTKEQEEAYLAGDFHLGIPDEKSSMLREKKIIKWLDSIEKHTQELF